MKLLKKLCTLPLLPLLLAPLALTFPVWGAGKAMFWGTPGLQFVPWWAWAAETIRAGNLPLWNPLLGMGAPLIANYQSGLFYPPNWIYLFSGLVGGAELLAWCVAPLMAFHLAFAGLGMSLLARRLGFGNLAQTICGLSFALSGYLVGRAGFLSISSAVAWLPWILLAADQLVASLEAGKPARKAIILAVVIALQLLAGHAQTAWYSLLLVGIWTSVRSWNCKQDSRTARLRRSLVSIRWLILAGLLAFMLSAVQLIPTAEYLMQSQRAAEYGFEQAMTYSFWPWHLLTLFAPFLFGSPVQGDYWGYAAYWEDAIYLGLLPALLAIWVLLTSLWNRVRKARGIPARESPGFPVGFLFLLIMVALVFALGSNTPLYAWLYRNVPTFDMFQAPARWLIWASFALSLLAGMGAERWRRPVKRDLYWTRLGTMGAFAVTVGSGLAWLAMGDISPTFIRSTALAGVWGIGAGLLSLIAPPGEPVVAEANPTRTFVLPEMAWQWLVILFVSLDLLVAGWGLNPGIELDFYRTHNPAANEIKEQLAGGRLYFPAEDERILKYERFFHFDSFYINEDWSHVRQILLPNILLLDQIPTTSNYDPFVPGRYSRWMGLLADLEAGGQAQAVRDRLKIMGASVIERIDAGEPMGVRFETVQGAKNVRVLSCLNPVGSETEAWETVRQPGFDPISEAVIEGLPPGGRCAPGERPEELTAIIQENISASQNPNEMTFQVETGAPGWLLLSTTTYPGWRASIDRTPAEIWTADYLFPALYLPGGTVSVRLTYVPVSFWSAFTLSLLAWIGLAFLGLHYRRRELSSDLLPPLNADHANT